MINNVSAFLSNVHNLNSSTSNRRTSSKGNKEPESLSVEVRDIVKINGRKVGSHLKNANSQNTDIQKESVAQKNNIQTAGEKKSENIRLEARTDKNNGSPSKTANQLSEPQKQEIEALQKRELEVRQHEQAHLAAAGRYAKGMSLTTRVGPDGRHYAVGGEVSIDLSAVPGDPDATIAKAQAIRRAANAPANPSSQDRLVAADATRMEAKARLEKIQQEKQVAPKGATAPHDKHRIAESRIENGNASDTLHQTSPTSSRAFSAYGINDSETGNLLNKVV